ncbi:AAA family ATPase [Kitasatospora sp. NPDC058478]|uniref:AAA family ATPase n=1 Tax=unclassified Kitasatospora TaxID=2633591 RepID=UPI003656F38B
MAATAIGAPANAGALVPHTFLQARRAQRQARPARILIDGPSGSGRTPNALDLAAGLAGPGARIGVIDTNNGASLRYADDFDFDIVEPVRFTPEHLAMGLYELGSMGYPVAVVDSYSPFWSGPGGLLELVDEATAAANSAADRARVPRPGSSAGWNAVRPRERMALDALLAYPGHVIVTVNAMTEVVLEETASGRTAPRRHGMKLDQRQGVEVPFDIALSLLPGDDHHALVAKSHVPELNGRILNLAEEPASEIGGRIAEWAADGVDYAPRPSFYAVAYDPQATIEGLDRLLNRLRETRAWGMAAYNNMPLKEDRSIGRRAETDGHPIALGTLVERRLNVMRASADEARERQDDNAAPAERPRPPAPAPVVPAGAVPEQRPALTSPPASLPDAIDTTGETDSIELAKAEVVDLLRTSGAWDEPFRLIGAWTRANERRVLEERVFCADGRYHLLRDLITARQAEVKAAMLPVAPDA